jgi:uncharacterized YceG family protein
VSDLSILGVLDDDGDHGPQRRGGRRQQKGSGRGGGIVALVVVLAMIAVIGLVGKSLIGKKLETPDYPGDGTGAVQVQVKPGDTSRDIAVTLVKLDVVKSEKAFNKAAEGDDASRTIQPGFYQLRHQMSGSAALALILDPASRLNTKVTIPEGLSSKQIFAILAQKTKLPVARFQAAARSPGALGAPAGARGVEGLLFPATYDFDPGMSAVDILTQMVATFKDRVDLAALNAAGQSRGLDWYGVLNVAALVEEEAITDDFGKVARVVSNRLADEKRLELDSTINYALGRNHIRVSEQELELDSPYNTYRVKGLPPTPISNPGMAAITAAMRPTPGNWLYFIKFKKDGHSYFTADYNDFINHKNEAKANGVY